MGSGQAQWQEMKKYGLDLLVDSAQVAVHLLHLHLSRFLFPKQLNVARLDAPVVIAIRLDLSLNLPTS